MNAGQKLGLAAAVLAGGGVVIVLLEWAWTEFKARSFERISKLDGGNVKKLCLAALVGMIGSLGYAERVNPTSNVMADSENTASTLVYRDSSGNVAVTVQDDAIVTAKIKDDSVTTPKIILDQPTLKVVCITTAKRFGNCTSLTAATGVCNACN